MAVVFSAARPLTRVWSNTVGGADVVSYLAAVVTVMPLYVVAWEGRSGQFVGAGRQARTIASKGLP
jgi:hypothetical protein